MPELPEVQTTVDGLNSEVKNWTIVDVWTDYNSAFHSENENIKNPKYFAQFKKAIVGSVITKTSRRAKNILIHLSSGDTILIHMKMTGHIMCGEYTFNKKEVNSPWRPSDPSPANPLNDPFNKFIHLVFKLIKEGKNSMEKQLVMSDMRKFAKVTLLKGNTFKDLATSDELRHLGPEPLNAEFTYDIFIEQLAKRKTAPIKQALMDQTLIAGIGNIYSDEILWKSGVHPKSLFSKITATVRKTMFKATKEILLKGIDFGGDSMSDYRNIKGLRGKFQNEHKAYRQKDKPCLKKSCTGTIRRLVIGGRSSHFCNVHQAQYS